MPFFKVFVIRCLAFFSRSDLLPLQAMLQARMGGALNSLGEFDRAREFLRVANDALAAFGDKAELAYAKLLLGNGWLAQGKLAEAEAAFAAVLEAEDGYVAGAVLANLGVIDQRLGRLAQAIARYDARLRQARTAGDIRNQAIARLNASTVYHGQSNYAEAETALREAESLWAQTNDRIGSAMTLGNLGELLMTQNRLDEAESCFQRALQSFRGVGQRHMISSTLGSLGKLAFLRGRIDDAVSHLHDCLHIAQAIDATDQLAIHRQTLADVHLARNDEVAARSTLLAALSAAGTAGERRQQFECVLRLARLEIRQNRMTQVHRALAALRAEPNLPEDICSEVDVLTKSVPTTTASPIMSLDALIDAVIERG